MKIPGFLKKKRTYVILVILGLIAWGWYASSRSAKTPNYETFTVTRTALKATTDVTGEIKPVARINLSFGAAGQVGAINVSVGQKVQKGDVLAELEAKDVRFAHDSAAATLASAQAQLDLARAGAKDQNIKISEAGVAQADANLEKAETDLANARISSANSLATAELALKTAENTLDSQTALLDQAITDAYDDAKAGYINAIGPMRAALTDGDRIIGVDDRVTNSAYAFQLGVTTQGSMDEAKSLYAASKTALSAAEGLVSGLNGASTHDGIDKAGDDIVEAVSAVQQYLNSVTRVLAGAMAGSSLSATDLATLKTAIQTHQAAIATKLTAVLTARQGTTSAVLTRNETISNLTDAVATARLSLQTAKSQSETNISSADSLLRVQRAARDAAVAQLDLTKAPPRAVDLDPLYASVASARAALDKAAADLRDAQIIAPVDGVISVVEPQLDERVGANQTIITMLSGDTYDIEVLIPESDIARVRTGQNASSTLDAYGDIIEFPGTVESIEPDQTLVQDAVYYKARVSIEADGHEIKPGMTANATVLIAQSASDALVIPARAVATTTDGKTEVSILESNGSVRKATVELGMKGDEGRVVVLSGLSEGDVIIVSQ